MDTQNKKKKRPRSPFNFYPFYRLLLSTTFKKPKAWLHASAHSFLNAAGKKKKSLRSRVYCLISSWHNTVSATMCRDTFGFAHMQGENRQLCLRDGCAVGFSQLPYRGMCQNWPNRQKPEGETDRAESHECNTSSTSRAASHFPAVSSTADCWK